MCHASSDARIALIILIGGGASFPQGCLLSSLEKPYKRQKHPNCDRRKVSMCVAL